jgi:hypothetical protein
MYKIIPITGRKTSARSQAKRRPASFLSKKSTKIIKMMLSVVVANVKK